MKKFASALALTALIALSVPTSASAQSLGDVGRFILNRAVYGSSAMPYGYYNNPYGQYGYGSTGFGGLVDRYLGTRNVNYGYYTPNAYFDPYTGRYVYNGANGYYYPTPGGSRLAGWGNRLLDLIF